MFKYLFSLKFIFCFLFLSSRVIMAAEAETQRTIELKNKINTNSYPDLHRYTYIYNKSSLSCPSNKKIILLVGQSLAANSGPKIKNFKSTKGLNYFESVCYQLSNISLGATGSRENLSFYISNQLENPDDFIWITTAWGGSSIIEWGMKRSFLSEYTNRHLLTLIKESNSKLKYIIFMQGETDNGYTDQFDYGKYFLDSISNIIKNVESPMFKIILTRSSRCDSNQIDNKLNKIKEKLEFSKNIYLLNVTDSLNNSYRRDGCHLNQRGIKIAAKEIAKKIDYLEGNE